MMRPVMAIALGAVAGALSRYYVGLTLTPMTTTSIPYGTLLANVTGCLLMGFLVTLSLGKMVNLHPDLRLLLLTGFLGSYTTFSSYELELAKLLIKRQITADLLYWGGSTFFGFLSLQMGSQLAERLLSHWEASLEPDSPSLSSETPPQPINTRDR